MGPTAGASASGAAPAATMNPHLAAAEPFEALAEQAFDATPAVLGDLQSQAAAKVSVVRGALTPVDAKRIDATMADIGAAVTRRDRAAIALASLEAYQVLVSGQDPRTIKVPIDVSLLDYAGFKSAALLKGGAPNWPAVAADVAYARAHWTQLSGQVTSPSLKAAFEESLKGMEAGSAQKNLPLAQHATATELSLVDLLEEYFDRR
ncbi:hypothetical protein [Phenylobacterium sp.]|uniref:hypothetical protein n=1 Tax=Phenylobacterium sp. TaxID=1871053 RepID=UPI00286A1DAE|nr:hypothetical protein [Phenylobacterium sp.]